MLTLNFNSNMESMAKELKELILKTLTEHSHKGPEGKDESNSTPNFIVVPEGEKKIEATDQPNGCLLYTSPSPRDGLLSRMPSSA